MKRVLVTGVRAPAALDLARSFEAAGCEVHLADSIHPWSVRLARFAPGRMHLLASPRFAFAAFTQDFARLVERLRPDTIVPGCEEVFYLAEAAARLGLSHRVFAPGIALLRRLHSKVDFARLARAASVCAPTTRRVTSTAELEPWRARAGELVFKPEFSRFASHVLVRPTGAALTRVVPTPAAPWAVQDFVAGEEICIWSAARAGDIVAFAAYRPRWRLGRSSSFYFETDRDPALFEAAAAIARATGATGHLSFDVVRRADGVISPIECNPRAVSGVHLFDADPGLAKALLGEAGLQRPRVDARRLGPAMWLVGAPQALFRGRIAEFRADLRRGADVLAREGEGPRAALGALLDAGRFALGGLGRGRSAAGQSTNDIEWNGEPIE